MNGKKARGIRKAMGIKKPTPMEGGGAYQTPGGQWMFKFGSNPMMNVYRKVKRNLT